MADVFFLNTILSQECKQAAWQQFLKAGCVSGSDSSSSRSAPIPSMNLFPLNVSADEGQNGVSTVDGCITLSHLFPRRDVHKG